MDVVNLRAVRKYLLPMILIPIVVGGRPEFAGATVISLHPSRQLALEFQTELEEAELKIRQIGGRLARKSPANFSQINYEHFLGENSRELATVSRTLGQLGEGGVDINKPLDILLDEISAQENVRAKGVLVKSLPFRFANSRVQDRALATVVSILKQYAEIETPVAGGNPDFDHIGIELSEATSLLKATVATAVRNGSAPVHLGSALAGIRDLLKEKAGRPGYWRYEQVLNNASVELNGILCAHAFFGDQAQLQFASEALALFRLKPMSQKPRALPTLVDQIVLLSLREPAHISQSLETLRTYKSSRVSSSRAIDAYFAMAELALGAFTKELLLEYVDLKFNEFVYESNHSVAADKSLSSLEVLKGQAMPTSRIEEGWQTPPDWLMNLAKQSIAKARSTDTSARFTLLEFNNELARSREPNQVVRDPRGARVIEKDIYLNRALATIADLMKEPALGSAKTAQASPMRSREELTQVIPFRRSPTCRSIFEN